MMGDSPKNGQGKKFKSNDKFPNFTILTSEFSLDISNFYFRSEIDLSETELPDKDLKLLEILVKR